MCPTPLECNDKKTLRNELGISRNISVAKQTKEKDGVLWVREMGAGPGGRAQCELVPLPVLNGNSLAMQV